MKSNKIEKLILDLSTRWEVSPEEVVDRLNHMNESEINKLINSMTKKFNNGGFIDCLRNGGSISKCKCGCDKIAKADNGGLFSKLLEFVKETPTAIRKRGTRPASAGIFQPDMVEHDNLWFKNNGAKVRNHFSGNNLTQYVITDGYYGTPRKVERIITNYNTPEKSDTIYMDAMGVTSGHSPKFIEQVNWRLEGAEPYATSAKDVRETNKKNKTGVPAKSCGGNLPKKSKFKK